MTLKSAIEAWDGQSVEALCRIHDAHRDDADLLPTLVELLGSLRYRLAATRLLKRHLESRGGVPDADAVVRSLCAKFDKLETWECRLNILQCLPCLPLPDDAVGAVEQFLRLCLADENKFVRAWAYNGFHWLARRHPRFSEESAAILAAGLRDEPPSIKARIRKCLAGVETGRWRHGR